MVPRLPGLQFHLPPAVSLGCALRKPIDVRWVEKVTQEMETSGPIRILIVDDHPVVRAGLSTVIGWEQDMVIVAQAVNAVEAVKEFRAHRPTLH